jgi:hypothetical protein
VPATRTLVNSLVATLRSWQLHRGWISGSWTNVSGGAALSYALFQLCFSSVAQ